MEQRDSREDQTENNRSIERPQGEVMIERRCLKVPVLTVIRARQEYALPSDKALQQLQWAVDKAKAKETAKLRAAQKKAEKMARLAQNKKEREKKAKLRGEIKRRQRR